MTTSSRSKNLRKAAICLPLAVTSTNKGKGSQFHFDCRSALPMTQGHGTPGSVYCRVQAMLQRSEREPPVHSMLAHDRACTRIDTRALTEQAFNVRRCDEQPTEEYCSDHSSTHGNQNLIHRQVRTPCGFAVSRRRRFSVLCTDLCNRLNVRRGSQAVPGKIHRLSKSKIQQRMSL